MGQHRAERARTRRTPAAPVRSHRAAARGWSARLRSGTPLPLAAGVTCLAIAIGGTAQSGAAIPAQLASAPATAAAEARHAPGALSGTSGVSAVGDLARDRPEIVSRDSGRQALDKASTADPQAAVEQQARERNSALSQLAVDAQKHAEKLQDNQWVLPLSGYRLTARFGASSSLWSRNHTGLDFAAPSGTPIRAVAGGTVTEMGYDGSYGNKLVITLEDGTEIWYCHLTSFDTRAGALHASGDVVGYVGSTGNSTGPHLHLEVRPGGGDPVDPFQALVVHGLAP